MRVSISCPLCKRSMTTSSAFSGQLVACPNCRGEFVLQLPGAVPAQLVGAAAGAPAPEARNDRLPPAPSAAGAFVPFVPPPRTAGGTPLAPAASAPGPPPPAPLPAGQAAPPPAALAAVSPAPAPPQPPPNTARLKLAPGAEPTALAGADGKLPSLMLAEHAQESSPSGGEKGAPMWLALAAVGASTLLSVVLLVGDPSGEPSAAYVRENARSELVQYYGASTGPVAPYQRLLREAQQAHSRGDATAERQKYQEVLKLLRAEGRGRYEGLTGTPKSDEELVRLLAILLAKD